MATSPERLDQIGEFALIDRLAALLEDLAPPGPRVQLAIGDDAALWTPRVGSTLAISTDTLVERIHFRLDLMTWQDVGHRALAANLSDLAAMGAQPGAAVVTLGLRGDLLVEDILNLYRGLGTLAARCNCPVIGGDIVASPTAVTLTVTVFGEQPCDAAGRSIALRRDHARPGDRLAVTGPLGLAAAGLRLLLANPGGADRDPAVAPLLAAYRRPEPRPAAGAALLAAGVRCGMDLSDGLAGDLAKICRRSGVGATIDSAALPIPPLLQERFPNDWLELALRGGEDFELLVSLPPALVASAQAALAAHSLPPLHLIGTIEASEPAAVATTAAPASSPIWLRAPDGSQQRLRPTAFDHFAGQ